jgi:hypothetical protein
LISDAGAGLTWGLLRASSALAPRRASTADFHASTSLLSFSNNSFAFCIAEADGAHFRFPVGVDAADPGPDSASENLVRRVCVLGVPGVLGVAGSDMMATLIGRRVRHGTAMTYPITSMMESPIDLRHCYKAAVTLLLM